MSAGHSTTGSSATAAAATAAESAAALPATARTCGRFAVEAWSFLVHQVEFESGAGAAAPLLEGAAAVARHPVVVAAAMLDRCRRHAGSACAGRYAFPVERCCYCYHA